MISNLCLCLGLAFFSISTLGLCVPPLLLKRTAIILDLETTLTQEDLILTSYICNDLTSKSGHVQHMNLEMGNTVQSITPSQHRHSIAHRLCPCFSFIFPTPTPIPLSTWKTSVLSPILGTNIPSSRQPSLTPSSLFAAPRVPWVAQLQQLLSAASHEL